VRPASLRTQKEYARRINAALELIDGNLGAEIPLSCLAAAANFSPYHFHRIFTALVGEQPAQFIRRLRLEKGARLLLGDAEPAVTEVALSCGFSTSALFCRLFKARFGMSPTAWRAGSREDRKKRQKESKIGKDSSPPTDAILSPRRWRMRNAPKVEVKDVAPFRVAYVKHMKGYEDSKGIEEAFQKLFFWAGPRGLISPEMKVLGISYDDPEITPKDKCRSYACVAVDERAEPDGEVGVMDIRPGKYAVGHFTGADGVFRKAYGFMYGEWLPSSGWQPDDTPALEMYLGEPGGSPQKKEFVFDLYIPVKPL